jgi:hypothetical protein
MKAVELGLGEALIAFTPYIAAIIGAATLVPPTTTHALVVADEGPYTATPVAGSATALTSATFLIVHPVELATEACHGISAKNVLHPDPDPAQADSLQPLLLLALVNEVPPTAITVLEEAGKLV